MRITVVKNEQNAYKRAATEAVLATLAHCPCEVVTREYGQSISACDLVIVLGGDGAILQTAKQLCESQTPLLGINLGRVGYLAELEPQDISKLSALFTTPWQIEARMMLDVTAGERTCSVLNDLVVRSPYASGVSRIGVLHDDVVIGSYYADGVIVATPTGSTAYTLSAGGAVLDPTLSCMSLTPVCPMGGRNRSLVFGADSTLRLRNLSQKETAVCLLADGADFGALLPGEEVRVSRSQRTARFLHLKRDSFCNTLREKVLDDEGNYAHGAWEGYEA